MLCVQRWSDARPVGRVRCWQIYNAESPKQDSKWFNFIMKTIHFAHLVILFIYAIQYLYIIDSSWYAVIYFVLSWTALNFSKGYPGKAEFDSALSRNR